jgi:hypothetical protein
MIRKKIDQKGDGRAHKLFFLVYKYVVYDLMIRLMIEVYMGVTLIVCINFQKLDFSYFGEALSSVVSIVFALIFCIFPISMSLLLYFNRSNLEDERLKEDYGSIYSDFKSNTTHALNY